MGDAGGRGESDMNDGISGGLAFLLKPVSAWELKEHS